MEFRKFSIKRKKNMKKINPHLHLRLHHLIYLSPYLSPYLSSKIYYDIEDNTHYKMKMIYNSESYDSYKLETFQ
jgi:hypothetical protein